MNDIQHDVRQFMAAFDQAMPDTPQWPDQATMDLRVRLEAEESCERLRDSGYMFQLTVLGVNADGFPALVFQDGKLHHRYTPNLPKTADAIIDQIYVLIGTLAAMGIDFWPLWREVQRANMAKAGGPVINGKVTKPEGWTPPDIEGELRKQGWEGTR